MKILGKTRHGFIIEATRLELAQILGHYHQSLAPDFNVGDEIEVSKIFDRLHAMRKSEEDLGDIRKSLRNLADLLEPIDKAVKAALVFKPEMPEA